MKKQRGQATYDFLLWLVGAIGAVLVGVGGIFIYWAFRILTK
jgi:hypothetical protein